MPLRFLPPEQQRKKVEYLFQGLGRKAGGSHQPPRHHKCHKTHHFTEISSKDAKKALQGTGTAPPPVGCCQPQGGFERRGIAGRVANFALDVSSKLNPNKAKNTPTKTHSFSPNIVLLFLTTALK